MIDQSDLPTLGRSFDSAASEAASLRMTEVGNSDAQCDETKNSKLKTQNLRLVSVTSETGATPRIQGLVRVAAGPWSLEDGWWNEQPVERDYWDVELSGGRLYRIYRDRKSGEWFADGMYD